jgi:predicted dehydrogenase
MEQVRIGVIGCGGMSRHHGKIFRSSIPEAQIVALAEPDAANLERYLKDVFPDGQDLPSTYSDHKTMLESVKLDGVLIVSPHAYHYQQTVDAIEAGCHVLLEKPMVINTPDALKLIEHAKTKNKIVSVAFPGPFSPEFQFIRKLIAGGALGEIYLVTGVCAQPWIKPVGGTWRTDPALSGGGNLYDSGAHMFNAMLYLTNLSALEVFAFVDNKGQDVDVIASVSLRLSGGALGSAAVSGDTTVFEQGIYIHGTKGSIKTSIYGGSLEYWDGADKVKYPTVPATSSLQQNFVDCIKGTTQTPSPPTLGLRQARLMDAIYESARVNAPVKVAATEEA